MTRKEVGSSSPWRRSARLWIVAAFGLSILGVALVRYFAWPAAGAQAQAPVVPRAAAPRGQQPAQNSPAPQAQPRAGARNEGVAAPPQAQQQPLKTMAVVNGEEITRQDLARECLNRFGNEVIESLVNRYLISQECRRRGVQVGEKEIDEEIVRIAQKFNLSPDLWIKMLMEERGVTLSQYRHDIIWPTLALRALAADQLQVTQEELDQAFESEYGRKVQCRMISVLSKEKAEQLLARAKANPEQFDALAKDYSEDPNSAAARGLIPPIRRHVGEPELERIAFSLQEGEISPVIHVANQYLILQCERHVPETHIAPQYRQEAAMRLEERIRDRKLRATASDVFRRLQEGAQVVNVYNDKKLSEQMPGVAATINGQQISLREVMEACLDRHGPVVLDGEINRKVLKHALAKRQIVITERDIDEEIARAAEAYGFVNERGIDVNGWLERVTGEENITVEIYVRDAVWPSVALKKLVTGRVQVTDEDLQKGFEANYGERVEVRAIVFGDQRTAQEVWDMARNNPTERFFGELANQYSIEAMSKANYGQVPPIQRFSGQTGVEEEAFRLRPGELSGIIAVGDKFIILKCLGRTTPVVDNIEVVRDELYADLHEKKLRIEMNDEFERLHKSAQIDNFLAGTTQTGREPQRAAQNGPPQTQPQPGATGARPQAPAAAGREGVRPAGFDGPRQPAYQR